MKSLPSMNGRVLRKTTAAGMIPLLLAQVLIALLSRSSTDSLRLSVGPKARMQETGAGGLQPSGRSAASKLQRRPLTEIYGRRYSPPPDLEIRTPWPLTAW